MASARIEYYVNSLHRNIAFERILLVTHSTITQKAEGDGVGVGENNPTIIAQFSSYFREN